MIAKSAAALRVDMDSLLYTATIVLNVKEDARVGQKTASAHYASMSSVDSIDDDGLNCC